MSNYIPPADKADGDTISGAQYNTLKNGLAAFLNNGNLGNGNFSTDPAEKLSGTKVDVTTLPHHLQHEPGGIDEVHDIDILNTGTLLSAHASRHASGGADPLPAGSISAAMLQVGALGETALLHRKDKATPIANDLGLTFNPLPVKRFTLGSSTANPQGNGVVRNGKVYFPAVGNDTVIELDPVTGTMTDINFVSGDDPCGMFLRGTDILVLCKSSFKIKKIDISNNVTLVLNLTGAPLVGTVDNTPYFVPNGDGTVVWFVYSNAGGAVNQLIGRATLGITPAVTHSYDSGVNAEMGPIMYAKDGTTELVFTIQDTTTNATLRRKNAADLTAASGGDLTLTGTNKRNAVFDGSYIIAADNNGTNLYLIDPFLSLVVATYGVPGGVAIDTVLPNSGHFFDGRSAWFAVRQSGTSNIAVAMRVPVPQYGGGIIYRLEDTGATGNDTGGFATDGNTVYASSGSSGGAGRIHRIPQ